MQPTTKKGKKQRKPDLKMSRSPKQAFFSKKTHKWPNRYMKRCLTSLIITKMTKDDKCEQQYGVKGTLIHCWWEHKLVQPL